MASYSSYTYHPFNTAPNPIASYSPPMVVMQHDDPAPVRKQNRSCDQCRKGKRRCDAVIPRDWPFAEKAIKSEQQSQDAGDGAGPNNIDGQLGPGPCTYCVKTKKICTFEWLMSHEPAFKARKESHPNDTSSSSSKGPKRHRSEKQHFSADPMSPSLTREGTNHSDSSHSAPSTGSNESNGYDPFALETTLSNESAESYNILDNFNQQFPIQSVANDSIFETSDQYVFVDSDTHPYAPPPSNPYEQNAITTWNQTYSNDVDISRLFARPKRALLPPNPSNSAHESEDIDEEFEKVEIMLDLSDNSLPERLSRSVNHKFISDNLFRIYHDSMENALSCWLNERSCPYRYAPKTITSGQDATKRSLEQAWSPDWPNRIFQRVSALDRVSGKFRDRPLSQRETDAASKALYLVIMAFASQWAQSSQRAKEEHKYSFENAQMEEEFAQGSSSKTRKSIEIDRRLQEAYWNAAKTALQECSDIESFRVAFANIIFSLTQKPLSDEQQAEIRRGSSAPLSPTDMPAFDLDDLSSRVDRVIDEDGPPIYLEQGVRHVHALRHKLQRRERELSKQNPHIESTRTILSEEDRTTVDLMAWLGYMLESLTSALHQRPLVVSDEDSDILPESLAALDISSTSTPAIPSKSGASRLWNDYFFLQERFNRQGAPLRLPCSYAEQAAGLTDAAPIKVLLYRKVTLLQSLFSRYAEPSKIEDAIQDSLKIYEHWGQHYEPFVKDCIANHDSLNPRIQSWYICVTGHWHLGTLLLADILSSIDASDSSCLPHRRTLRTRTNLINALRSHNANMSSHLARCATPRSSASFAQSPFHHALNSGALLTEPWTALLIRVFAKAAVILLREASDAEDPIKAEDAALRSEDCIRALKYLGRKSDTARLAGDTLEEALGRERSGQRERFGGGSSRNGSVGSSVMGGGLDGIRGGDGGWSAGEEAWLANEGIPVGAMAFFPGTDDVDLERLAQMEVPGMPGMPGLADWII